MRIQVYNLESYECFSMTIFRSLCHSFDFVNTRFKVKIIFFPVKFYKKIYFYGKFVTEFCSFFALTYVPLDEWTPFNRKIFFPSFNKTGKLQVFTLYLPKCFEYT